jgi:hypothetical protein
MLPSHQGTLGVYQDLDIQVFRGNSRGLSTMDATITRRRSQRLFLQVRVIVEAEVPGRPPVHEETQTIVINAHGALIEMSACLEEGQMASLQNVRTSEKIECKIKLVKAAGAGKFSTAFEFIHPSPDFWRISFPPEDWPIRNVDVKKPG